MKRGAVPRRPAGKGKAGARKVKTKAKGKAKGTKKRAAQWKRLQSLVESPPKAMSAAIDPAEAAKIAAAFKTGGDSWLTALRNAAVALKPNTQPVNKDDLSPLPPSAFSPPRVKPGIAFGRFKRTFGAKQASKHRFAGAVRKLALARRMKSKAKIKGKLTLAQRRAKKAARMKKLRSAAMLAGRLRSKKGGFAGAIAALGKKKPARKPRTTVSGMAHAVTFVKKLRRRTAKRKQTKAAVLAGKGTKQVQFQNDPSRALAALGMNGAGAGAGAGAGFISVTKEQFSHLNIAKEVATTAAAAAAAQSRLLAAREAAAQARAALNELSADQCDCEDCQNSQRRSEGANLKEKTRAAADQLTQLRARLDGIIMRMQLFPAGSRPSEVTLKALEDTASAVGRSENLKMFASVTNNNEELCDEFCASVQDSAVALEKLQALMVAASHEAPEELMESLRSTIVSAAATLVDVQAKFQAVTTRCAEMESRYVDDRVSVEMEHASQALQSAESSQATVKAALGVMALSSTSLAMKKDSVDRTLRQNAALVDTFSGKVAAAVQAVARVDEVVTISEGIAAQAHLVTDVASAQERLKSAQISLQQLQNINQLEHAPEDEASDKLKAAEEAAKAAEEILSSDEEHDLEDVAAAAARALALVEEAATALHQRAEGLARVIRSVTPARLAPEEAQVTIADAAAFVVTGQVALDHLDEDAQSQVDLDTDQHYELTDAVEKARESMAAAVATDAKENPDEYLESVRTAAHDLYKACTVHMETLRPERYRNMVSASSRLSELAQRLEAVEEASSKLPEASDQTILAAAVEACRQQVQAAQAIHNRIMMAPHKDLPVEIAQLQEGLQKANADVARLAARTQVGASTDSILTRLEAATKAIEAARSHTVNTNASGAPEGEAGAEIAAAATAVASANALADTLRSNGATAEMIEQLDSVVQMAETHVAKMQSALPKQDMTASTMFLQEFQRAEQELAAAQADLSELRKSYRKSGAKLAAVATQIEFANTAVASAETIRGIVKANPDFQALLVHLMSPDTSTSVQVKPSEDSVRLVKQFRASVTPATEAVKSLANALASVGVETNATTHERSGDVAAALDELTDAEMLVEQLNASSDDLMKLPQNAASTVVAGKLVGDIAAAKHALAQAQQLQSELVGASPADVGALTAKLLSAIARANGATAVANETQQRLVQAMDDVHARCTARQATARVELQQAESWLAQLQAGSEAVDSSRALSLLKAAREAGHAARRSLTSQDLNNADAQACCDAADEFKAATHAVTQELENLRRVGRLRVKTRVHRMAVTAGVARVQARLGRLNERFHRQKARDLSCGEAPATLESVMIASTVLAAAKDAVQACVVLDTELHASMEAATEPELNATTDKLESVLRTAANAVDAAEEAVRESMTSRCMDDAVRRARTRDCVKQEQATTNKLMAIKTSLRAREKENESLKDDLDSIRSEWGAYVQHVEDAAVEAVSVAERLKPDVASILKNNNDNEGEEQLIVDEWTVSDYTMATAAAAAATNAVARAVNDVEMAQDKPYELQPVAAFTPPCWPNMDFTELQRGSRSDVAPLLERPTSRHTFMCDMAQSNWTLDLNAMMPLPRHACGRGRHNMSHTDVLGALPRLNSRSSGMGHKRMSKPRLSLHQSRFDLALKGMQGEEDDSMVTRHSAENAAMQHVVLVNSVRLGATSTEFRTLIESLQQNNMNTLPLKTGLPLKHAMVAATNALTVANNGQRVVQGSSFDQMKALTVMSAPAKSQRHRVAGASTLSEGWGKESDIGSVATSQDTHSGPDWGPSIADMDCAVMLEEMVRIAGMAVEGLRFALHNAMQDSGEFKELMANDGVVVETTTRQIKKKRKHKKHKHKRKQSAGQNSMAPGQDGMMAAMMTPGMGPGMTPGMMMTPGPMHMTPAMAMQAQMAMQGQMMPYAPMPPAMMMGPRPGMGGRRLQSFQTQPLPSQFMPSQPGQQQQQQQFRGGRSAGMPRSHQQQGQHAYPQQSETADPQALLEAERRRRDAEAMQLQQQREHHDRMLKMAHRTARQARVAARESLKHKETESRPALATKGSFWRRQPDVARGNGSGRRAASPQRNTKRAKSPGNYGGRW